jgi:hypothetical protein
MPETENAQSKELCHVHDEAGSAYEVGKVRRNVCRDLQTMRHIDGNYYCLLHLPDQEKDADKFGQIVQARIDEVSEKAAAIKARSSDDVNKQKEEIAKLSYDLSFVWFPKVNFSPQQFPGACFFQFGDIFGQC